MFSLKKRLDLLLHGCQLDNSCDFSIGAEVVDLFELTSALVNSSENDDNFHFFYPGIPICDNQSYTVRIWFLKS